MPDDEFILAQIFCRAAFVHLFFLKQFKNMISLLSSCVTLSKMQIQFNKQQGEYLLYIF